MKRLTTKEMVQKCFCAAKYTFKGNNGEHYIVFYFDKDFRCMASAARQFVKMENEQKGLITTKNTICVRCRRLGKCELSRGTVLVCSRFIKRRAKSIMAGNGGKGQ